MFRKKTDLEQWKEERGYDTSFEEEQRAERRKEFGRNLLTVGLVVALIVTSVVAIKIKSNRDDAPEIAQEKERVIASTDENRMNYKAEDSEEALSHDEVTTSSGETVHIGSSDSKPSPTPTPPSPSTDEDSKPVPQPNPNPDPSPKNPDSDLVNDDSDVKDPNYPGDPVPDPSAHDAVTTAHENDTPDTDLLGTEKSVERAELDVARAEANLLLQKISLYRAENPKMDRNDSTYNRMANEYLEKCYEVRDLEKDYPQPNPNPSTAHVDYHSNSDPQPTPSTHSGYHYGDYDPGKDDPTP